MPTYEYACRACGHVFDIVQSMKDESLTVCPECGGELRKVFHAAAISFKGSGFYATDSRKKSSSGTPSSSEKPEKSEKSGEKKDATSDTKPEKKTETTKASETTTSAPKKEKSS